MVFGRTRKMTSLKINVLVPELKNKFVAGSHFTLNEGFIVESDPDNDLAEIVVSSRKGHCLTAYLLDGAESDTGIISELHCLSKEHVETDLYDIYYLIKSQKGIESGLLTQDGRSNIFYVRNKTQALRTIVVCIYKEKVHVTVLRPFRIWHPGRRVISRI